MSLTKDQQAVGEFGSDSAYEPEATALSQP
jgi:hypothetical protein